MSAKSKSESFKKGELVQARWAGSKQFYGGKIVEVLKTICKVQFDNDGSVSSVKLADIKKLDKKEDSPKTAKLTRSRSRSSGRASRSRSRSPARKEKAKVEKPKIEKRPHGRPKKKPQEKLSNTNNVSKDEIDSNKSSLIRESISRVNLSPTVKLNSFTAQEMNVILAKESTSERFRSTRLSTLRLMESNQQLLDAKQSSDTKIIDKAKYSDDEEEEEEEEEEDDSKLISKKPLSKTWQMLYFFTTLLKILKLPGLLLFLIFACTAKQCTILEVPHFFSRWTVLVNSIKIPLACVAVFHMLLCLLPLIPLGKKVAGFPSVDSKTPLEYRLHGFIYLICSIGIFAACFYFGVNLNWGYDKFKPIALSSYLYCTLFALLLYVFHAIRGGGPVHTKVPFIGKFYNGHFTNPVLFGKIDVKTSFIRAGLIGSVILNCSILMKYFLMKGGRFCLPLCLTSGMQIFFVLDLLFREEKLLSTSTYTSDSVGYAFIITTGFLIPFGLSIQSIYLYLFEAKVGLPLYWNYAVIATSVLFYVIGYYIYLTSSNLKHNFRRDPYGKLMLKHDSIPTVTKARRLLVSGGWGLVRHPNYLGILMMAVAWTLPCGFLHFVPFGPLILLTVALVLRIFRIEEECKEKHGPGWKNYKEKVHSRLIPYIF